MRKGQGWFKLTIVVLIVSIVAIIAIPRFIDLTRDGKIAATNAMAAALSSANSANYIHRKAHPSKGVKIVNCTDVVKTLKGGISSDFSILPAEIPADVNASCTLNGPSSTTAIFVATGII